MSDVQKGRISGRWVSVLASSIYLEYRLLHPLRALAGTAEAVAAGELDKRAPVSGPREFAEVAGALNRMLDARERHTAELERRTLQLIALGRMGQAVAAILDEERLLREVLVQLGSILPAASSVSLWTAEDEAFRRVTCADGEFEVTTCAREDAPPEVSRVFQKSERVVVEERSEGVVLAAPLLLGEATLGVMTARHEKARESSEEDLRLLEAAASWTAIAIGNARQHGELRRLSQKVITAQEEERERLSRELHDEAGQSLTALKIQLDLLEKDAGAAEEVEARFREAREILDETMERLRSLSHALHPPLLGERGLSSALQEVCSELSRRARLRIDYRGEQTPPLSDDIRLCCYRFLQEALTNVVKHADATRVSVELHHERGAVCLEVTDDGKGFDPHSQRGVEMGKGGIGIRGMQERFRALGGEVHIESAPGRGTRLTARFPIGEASPTKASEHSEKV